MREFIANYIKHAAHIARVYINQRQDSLSREKKKFRRPLAERERLEFHFSKFAGALGKETLHAIVARHTIGTLATRKKKKKRQKNRPKNSRLARKLQRPFPRSPSGLASTVKARYY